MYQHKQLSNASLYYSSLLKWVNMFLLIVRYLLRATSYSKDFLTSKGVPMIMSWVTSCNPVANGQVRRYNVTIWKLFTMHLKSKAIPTEYWQETLPDVLHLSTPFYVLQPIWHLMSISLGLYATPLLAIEWPILILSTSSHFTEPLIDVADLIQTNPHCDHICYPDGRETTVSRKELARKVQISTE